MSTAELLGIISALFLLLVGMVGVIFNGLRERIRALEAKDFTAVLQSRIDSVVAHLGKLEGQFEQRTRDRDKFDYDWRHGEYTTAISGINAKLYPLVTKMESVERDVEGLRELAYLSKAIDGIERRVAKLEAKVFQDRWGDQR